MAGKKKTITSLYLQGSTLFEVIVASIIILVAFMLFSVTLSQLFGGRKLNDEIRTLLVLPDISRHTAITNAPYTIDNICRGCTIQVTEQTNHLYTNRHLLIKNPDNKTPVLILNVPASPISVDSLFQY